MSHYPCYFFFIFVFSKEGIYIAIEFSWSYVYRLTQPSERQLTSRKPSYCKNTDHVINIVSPNHYFGLHFRSIIINSGSWKCSALWWGAIHSQIHSFFFRLQYSVFIVFSSGIFCIHAIISHSFSTNASVSRNAKLFIFPIRKQSLLLSVAPLFVISTRYVHLDTLLVCKCNFDLERKYWKTAAYDQESSMFGAHFQLPSRSWLWFAPSATTSPWTSLSTKVLLRR